MALPSSFRTGIPLGLGLAMLAVVVAAALVPNAGVVAAQSSCQYSDCNQSTTSSFPLTYALIGLIAAAAVAGLLIFLLVRRRGGRGPGTGVAPYGESSGGAGARETEPAAPSEAGEGAEPTEEPPREAYDEGAPEAPAPSENGSNGTGDIDSLMNELERMGGK